MRSWGLGIGARHITISTSGLAPQIRELANESTQFRLALSLHGATDEVRSRIMPVNRRYPLKVLLEACDYYVAKKRRMTFEYILIAGVNDTDEQARELAKIARRLSAKINLIPYNTVEGLDWSRPSRPRQEKFQSILREHGVIATCAAKRATTSPPPAVSYDYRPTAPSARHNSYFFLRTFSFALATSEWSRVDASDIDGKTERPNGAFGKSDIEGKTARVVASELGKARVSNGWEHMSQFQSSSVGVFRAWLLASSASFLNS